MLKAIGGSPQPCKASIAVQGALKCMGKSLVIRKVVGVGQRGVGAGGEWIGTHVVVHPYNEWGNLPPLTVAAPIHFPQVRGGFIISPLRFVSGREDVATFGGKWRLGRWDIRCSFHDRSQNPKLSKFRRPCDGYQSGLL